MLPAPPLPVEIYVYKSDRLVRRLLLIRRVNNYPLDVLASTSRGIIIGISIVFIDNISAISRF